MRHTPFLCTVEHNFYFSPSLAHFHFVSFRFAACFLCVARVFCFGEKIVASFREAVHVDKTLKSGSHRRRNLTNKSRDK